MYFQSIIQTDSRDCGSACVQMIANHYGHYYPLHVLKEKCTPGKDGISLYELQLLSKELNFNAVGHQISSEILVSNVKLPCIVHWDQNHFVVLYKIVRNDKWNFLQRSDKYYIADPTIGKITYTQKEFERHWLNNDKTGSKAGIILNIEPGVDFKVDKEDKVTRNYLSLVKRYITPHKKNIFKLIIAMIIGMLFQFIAPFITQMVVDKGIGTKSINFVVLALIGQLTLMISRSAVDFYRNWILLHINTKIDISLIYDFLAKLMRLPIRFFESRMVGDIMQRIYDHTRIQNFLTGSSLNILFSFVSLIVFAVILSIYNWKILLVFVIFSILYFVWVWIFLGKRRKIDHMKFALSSSNQSRILQIVSGMQEVKLNNCDEPLKKKWHDVQNELYEVNIESLKLSQYQQGGGLLINELKNILITFISAYSVIQGNITLGMMMSIQYIIGQLNAPVEQMINFIQSAQDAKLSLERLEEVHRQKNEDEENEIREIVIPNNPDIKLNNLTFRYNSISGPDVLSRINLTIPYGKTTAIIGSSGSGKTTLIKLLLGFYKPNSGEILIGKTPFHNIDINTWRFNCGTVLQDGFIFSDTITFNISLNDKINNQEKIDKALYIANISQFINELPLGLNTVIGSEGVGISQGQKQRILIARSVYKDPEFMFFDEATNSLDADNEKVIMNRLNSFFESESHITEGSAHCKKRTVIVVAHRLSTVRKADQIVVLEKGKIVEIGKHQELIAKKGRYFELVKDQLELTEE